MTTENAIETVVAQPSAAELAATAELTAKNRAIDQAENVESEEDKAARLAELAKAKPEKTPEQREIERLRRGIDRKTRQLAEERTRAQFRESTFSSGERPANNRAPADDDTPVTLTRAEVEKLVKAEAAKLAPTLRDQLSEVERRQSVVQGLAKEWGSQRFDELSSDLDDAFGGLEDASGRPKPAIEAVFEADSPAKVIEWLADPDNADEAERISKLSAVQAGKAIAKLEAKLATEAKDKPQPSKAPAPLEPVRGAGKPEKRLADLSGADFDKRRREQIAQRR